MSKEAMKLALEALESLKVTVSSRTEANVIDGVDLFPKQMAALQKALANEALDKMAENARELGLDYEPPCKTGSQCTSKCQQCEQPAQQQEPLEYWNAVEGWVKIDEVREHFDSVGCGTIYKTPGDGRVPLTTAHRKPLTDEQIEDIWADCPADWDDKINVLTLARAIEAAHGIKENT